MKTWTKINPGSVRNYQEGSLIALKHDKPEIAVWFLKQGIMQLPNNVLIRLQLLSFSCQNNNFEMTSTSMEPTIKKGEVVSADLSIYNKELPSRGDVVLFHSPVMEEVDWVMRVVGLPGEVVSFDSNGILINNNPLDYATFNVKYDMSESGIGSSKILVHPYQIPKNQYYLLGDNVNDAYDSRFWGSIPKDQIFGKVIEN